MNGKSLYDYGFQIMEWITGGLFAMLVSLVVYIWRRKDKTEDSNAKILESINRRLGTLDLKTDKLEDIQTTLKQHTEQINSIHIWQEKVTGQIATLQNDKKTP